MNELKFCSDSSENLLIINPKNGKQLKKTEINHGKNQKNRKSNDNGNGSYASYGC